MVEKVQVLGRTGRNSLQKSTTFNVSGKRQSQFQRLNYSPSVPGPISIDSNFRYNTLLIHADGTSGANNTVFLDNSGANTYIPFNGTYSNYFDGSSKLVATVAAPGTGSVTYEAWFRLPSGTGCITNSRSGDTADGVDISVGANRQIVVTYQNVVLFSGTTNQVSFDTWYHVAVVRNGTTNWTVYLNGTSIGTFTSSNNLTSTYLSIAQNNPTNNNSPFTGHISNVRVTNSAVYTSNFTPSTVPLTSSTSPQLLTCQSPIIVDNSTNNRTITITGNPLISSGGTAVKIGAGKPLQGTFSPFSQTGWSNLFNGSTDYLQFPRAAGLITTGPFTVEAWVNIAAHKASNIIIADQYWSTGQNGGWNIAVDGSGFVVFSASEQVFNTFPAVVTSSSAISVNTWYHIAVVRDQNNFLNLYVNGALAARPVLYNFDLSRNTGGTQTNWLTNIGITNADGTNYNFINGYVSNARIVKGIAVYTEPFNPPTTPLSTIGTPDNTTLLTCRDNRLRDSSLNANALTIGGTPSVQVYSPIVNNNYSTTSVGGSFYLNGTSEYITPQVPSIDFTGDFTIECWAYDLGSTAYGTLLGWRTAGVSYTGFILQRNNSANNLTCQVTISGTAVNLNQTSGTYLKNSWNHVAIVRSGTTVTLWVNGVSAATGTVSGTVSPGTSMWIGQDPQNIIASTYFAGYISNYKVVNGKALYTSTFTPPTAPATTSDAPVLLLNGTNSGIIDNTGRNNLTTYGSAAVSSTQSKFGGTSISFNGTTDYITTTSVSNIQAFGSGDFTVEMWVYFNNTTGTQVLFDGRPSGTSTTVNYAVLTYASTLNYYTNNGNPSITGSALNANQWYHIALCRSGTSTRLFVNGIQVGSTLSDSQSYINGANRPILGADGNVVGSYFNGYIDDLRISKVARYTSNFTPPTAAFADQ
jgi:Concanavalin A-like lectin/glucanases superfamily